MGNRRVPNLINATQEELLHKSITQLGKLLKQRLLLNIKKRFKMEKIFC